LAKDRSFNIYNLGHAYFRLPLQWEKMYIEISSKNAMKGNYIKKG